MEMRDKIAELVEMGAELHRKISPEDRDDYTDPPLDSFLFTSWKTQTLSLIESNFSSTNVFYLEFLNGVVEPYRSSIHVGMGVLHAIQSGIESGTIGIPSESSTPLTIVENICDRFHLVVGQLRNRYSDRVTIDVQDEYDTQDLFHALLHLYFDDIRPEEYTPSYAGKSSRVDFLLKKERIVVELKKTRKGLGAKEVGTQLIEDIHRYKAHPDCDTLLCFVYDPDGIVANPRGIENDLSEKSGELTVEVWIRPAI